MKSKLVISFVILFLLISNICISPITYAAGANEILWSKINATDWFYDVIYANNMYAAVGSDGTIMTSKDGVTWENKKSGLNTNFKRIVWNGKLFVAVGENFTPNKCFGIAISEDGNTWTAIENSSYNYVTSIVWANDTFVAGGGQGIIISNDGLNWTKVQLPSKLTISSIAWDGSKFAAVSQTGDVILSEDAKNWSAAASLNSYITGLAWGNNGFVAIGSNEVMFYSADGVKWTSAKVQSNSGNNRTDNYASINFVQGKFFVFYSSGKYLKSVDGVNWESGFLNIWYDIFGMAYGPCGYVAVGAYSTIMNSSDGSKWTLITRKDQRNLNSVIWDGKQFIALGSFGNQTSLFTSKDGFNWSVSRNFYVELISIYFNGKDYICAGSNGAVYLSKDLINWTPGKTGVSSFLLSVTWGNDCFVAVGNDGTIITSKNGVDWEKRNSEFSSYIRSVKWCKDRFIACGARGLILTSPDGVTWSKINSGVSAQLNDVIYNNNKFLIVGYSETILYSDDGNKWIQVPIKEHGFHNITWDGTKFLVTGTNGYILVSNDGVNWVSNHTAVDYMLYDIAANGYVYVAVGFNTAMVAGVSGGYKIKIDGSYLKLENEPVNQNGRLLVPFRAIFEALGGNVSWDEKTRTVKAARNNSVIELQIDNKLARVNENQVTLDVPAQIINEVTYVPLRFISENFGAKVDWDEETKTAIIKTK